MSDVSVKNVALTGETEWNGDPMGRIRMGSVVGLLGSSGPSTVSGVTVEDVTGKNLDGETVTLPVVGANYTGSIGNATEAKVGDDYYATLTIALSKAESGDTITLLADVDMTESIEISGELTIDLNGYTLAGTDSATGSFGLINIQPGADLTINDSSTDGTGRITLTAENNREWNAYSSVISNQRGKLTVNGGTIEHKGGTDMAYAIDNLTNTGAEIAETTINDGVIKSTYRAIRQFLNSSAEGVNNILTVNGGTIEGVNKSIWMQDANTSANIGTLTVSDEATLVGDVYLFVTEGSTEWPVSVSIADDAFADGYTVMTANVPVGTKVDVVGGYWGISDANTSYVAAIKGVSYTTLQDAIDNAKDGDTITLLKDVTIKESTIKLPATMTNVTIKGAEGAVLKDMTIMAADGNSINYEGITFDGLVFDNSRISITGWRNGEVSVKNLAVTNCVFKNLNDDTNSAPVHINMDADEAVNGFTFTDNEIDGATGGSKSGVYAQLTGAVTFTGNTINNVAFRPYIIQITTDDGVADTFTVTNNTFSGSAVGRAQGLGNNAEGTDSVTLTVTNNIFTGITSAQQICYWNFNAETTTADISKNYYDIDISENPSKIYFNKAAQSVEDLAEFGVYPVYTELNEDGTIDATSLYEPVASIGATFYDTLAAAVAAAVDGDTITLYSDNAETVSVARDVTFTLRVVEGKEFSGSIEAGNYTTLTKTENTYAFDYTAPSSSGGGGGSTSYTITVEDTENGEITVSSTRASSGSTVTITVDPDSGYELDELTVLDKNGKEIKLTKKSDSKYTFKMPSGKVTIEATFAEIEAFENPFTDVAEGAYYYDAVLWAAESGITGGTSATTFSPAVTCTRAQTVTFLWRAAGSPDPEGTNMPFTDVASDAYYYDAVLWAVENGITSGTSATTFSPNATVTRAQNVTFLWRWAESSAVEAVNPFTDVAADMYYHDAVLWAADEGITAGTSATTFSPDDPCLRSQIVTFLYRYLVK
jgi:hypothetical protein